MKKKESFDNERFFGRLIFASSVFTVLIFLVLYKFFNIQVIHGKELSEVARKQRIRKVFQEALRGSIYDRVGRELTVNLQLASVYAVPRKIKNKKKVAKVLSKNLNLPYSFVFNRLKRDKLFVWLKRKVKKDAIKKIKKQKLKWIGFLPERKRFYPKGKLSSQIIGFTGIDLQGLYGLEKQYDDILKGTPGEIIAERDVRGEVIPSGFYKFKPPVNGRHIVLTIDETIQSILEGEIEKMVKNFKAETGIGIIMKVKTGEVLAMASYPDFDPNFYFKYKKEYWKNKAIQYTYEPGSTLKVILASIALETGKYRRGRSYYTSSPLKVGRHLIRNAHNEALGWLNLKDIVVYSSNVGAAQVAFDLGEETYIKFLRKFGFGEKTGISLPGEENGIFPRLPLRKVTLANLGFGQGISVTPIQLLNAISSLGNKGMLLKPYILKYIKSPSGKIEKEFKPQVIRRVVSEKTANEVLEILHQIVKRSTGKKAEVNNYFVGGKTGTAQKAIRGVGYSNSKYIASFIGLAPLPEPEISVLIIADEPKTSSYGGVVAAPTFSAVVERTLNYLNIPPSISNKGKSY
jgi:cell division protein FtsI/penicillin-binding protein 2